jgi:uncharacterized membrane protein YoaK (UPF0700 family)
MAAGDRFSRFALIDGGNGMWRLGLLCGIAGYVDGWGYTQIGRVFAANMTGNTVLFGIALAEADWRRAVTYATTLFAFFLAGIVASIIRRALQRSDIILYGSAACLLLALLPREAPELVLALLAVAMAFQGAAVQRFGRMAISTVVVTSTMLRLAEGIVGRVWRSSAATRPEALEAVPMSATAWATYAVGGATTIAGAAYLTSWALVLPALLLVVIAARLPRGRDA